MNKTIDQLNRIKACIVIMLVVAITACGSSESSKPENTEEINTSPVVVLAESTRFMQSAKVSLNASVTDSNLSAVKWEFVSGPEDVEVSLDNISLANTHFLAPNSPGDYTFSITATDSEGLQTIKETKVTVVGIDEYLTPKLNTIMQDTFLKYQEGTANMAFSINFEGLDYMWQSAIGLADVSEQREITTQDAIRIASVTKTVTVATALKMIEKGHFELDTPIGELLTNDDLPSGYTVDDLHVKDGIKRGSTLTIRQLMDQSTGIKDYISYLFDPLSPDALELASILLEPNDALPAIWTPQALLSNLLDRGLTQDLDLIPGEQHLYSDTNALLLGVILEKVGNAPLHTLMAENIFIPLNMDDTYMDFHQESTLIPVDHYYPATEEYYGDLLEDYMYGNHNAMELEMNTSFSWAGGGLVSTLNDLDRFFSAIKHNTLILDEQLQQEWREWKLPNGDKEYGLGLDTQRFKFNNTVYEYTGHGGNWGLKAGNIAPIDVRIIAWVGQAEIPAREEFFNEVLKLLHEIGFQYQKYEK